MISSRRARARRDAALHRSDAHAADLGRFLVGEAAGADQDQRFALLVRQQAHGAQEIVEFQMTGLRGDVGKARGMQPLGILDLAPTLATLRIELVA